MLIVYNVPQLRGSNESLRLTKEIVSKIFGGQIRNWRHPELTELNPNIGRKGTDAESYVPDYECWIPSLEGSFCSGTH